MLWTRRKIGEEECCGLGGRWENKNVVGKQEDRRRRMMWVRRKIGEEECCWLGER
jgi:hypothetical protein